MELTAQRAGTVRLLGYGVRPLIASDIGHLMATVGPLVDNLYPGGATRLCRRLEQARDGYAAANVVVTHGVRWPVGLAAEITKGPAALKLSTFWIAPEHRHRGYGALLLSSRIRAWNHAGIEQVHVTVRRDRARPLERLFLPRGFEHVAHEVDRYGEGRDELTLRWQPANLDMTRSTT